VKETILLVDDEPNLRELLRQMLELGNFVVVEAVDGFDALQKLEEFVPDVMVLDVMMPNMDGVTLCKKLRTMPEFFQLPIIMLSGKTQHKAVQEGLAAGANQYLCKPITVSELIQSVRILLLPISVAN
jgi:DNA-binding response OmpR family regulator